MKKSKQNLPKMNLLKEKMFSGKGLKKFKKIKPLPVMDFLKKKTVWGKGLTN